ncbi:hypothetical protein KY345_03905 [Candidatus Woesearchaeota archaeon]|nr:hypothetical protein [Candidatus Woesearchaeota archaeon]
MEKPIKYKYFKTLGDSVKLLWNNPKIIVPYLLFFVFLVIFSYVTKRMQTTILADIANIQQYVHLAVIWLSMVLLLFVLSIFLGGWVFSLINQLMKKEPVSLLKSLKRAFSFGIRIFLISIIGTLFIVLIYLLAYAIISATENIGLSIVGFVFGLLFIVFFILFMTAFAQVSPVLIVEDKGTIETIRQAIRFYFKKKLYSLNIFLVSVLIATIALIPSMLFGIFLALSHMGQAIAMQQVEYTAVEEFIASLLQFFVYIGSTIIMIYYSVSYKIKKETIKEK